ncbi:MAG: glycosyltransferase, partial [Bacteroidales bacterium]|nr:glycosyltransferase [Bacteroidales bacterium]
SIVDSTPVRTVFTGLLSSQDDIIRVYLASDVFVTPTLADNFPNVLLEAMACGVPCVGFDSGGVKDLVLHTRTGYLSRRCDPVDLKTGVEWVLEDGTRYSSLSTEARRYVLESFSYGRLKEIHKELPL